jgi:hypothetical protein
VVVPAELTDTPLVRLTLAARDLRRAGVDAEPYSAITPDTEAAFFLWYIRIIPD